MAAILSLLVEAVALPFGILACKEVLRLSSHIRIPDTFWHFLEHI